MPIFERVYFSAFEKTPGTVPYRAIVFRHTACMRVIRVARAYTNDHETKSTRHRLLTRVNVIIIFALSCPRPRAQTTMIHTRFYRDYLADHHMLARRSSKSIRRDFRANQACLLKRCIYWDYNMSVSTMYPRISLGYIIYIIKYIFTSIINTHTHTHTH